MPRLTPTSYALLALLDSRSYSAYDLTKEMRRSVSQCWPRAMTSLYKEPKNLVAHGLARAKVEMHGRQSRTVYSITPTGRRMLKAWFAESSSAPLFESEAVVKLVFGDRGRRDQLIATIDEFEAHFAGILERGMEEIPLFIERVNASAEQVHYIELVAKLYLGYYEVITRWANEAREEIAGRPVEP